MEENNKIDDLQHTPSAPMIPPEQPTSDEGLQIRGKKPWWIIGGVILITIFVIIFFRGRGRPTIEPTPGPIVSGDAEWGFFGISLAGDPLDDLVLHKWGRMTGMVWKRLQDLGGDYNWELMDDMVQKAQDNGYNLIFVLKTGNGKIFSEETCFDAVEKSEDDDMKHIRSCPIKPEYEDDWKDLVFNIIERYDGDGKSDMPGLEKDFILDIQIENEAGSPDYWYFNERKDGKNAADEYLKILKLAYEAKEEANPSTKIIFPGLIHANRIARCEKGIPSSTFCSADHQKRNEDFTKEVLRHPEYFDAIDIHEFIYFKFDPYYIQDGITWLKEEMKKNGYTKPIFSLEWTGSIMLRVRSEGFEKEFAEYFPYTDEFDNLEDFFLMYKDLSNPENKKYRDWFESEQAREYPKLFTTMLVNSVEKLVHVRFTDLFRGFPGQWDNVWWNWQGIIRYEGTRENPILIKKPSYHTHNIISEKIAGFDSTRELDFGRNTFVYEFNFGDKDSAYEFNLGDKDSVYIAWTEGPDKTIDLSQYISSKNVKITHIVTGLDSNNNPIYKDGGTSQANSVVISDIPIFIE